MSPPLLAWQGDERLLRLYEGGLPTWAIYAAKLGFPYRPWQRTLTWLLFMAVSVFSLLTGFYDLYRHMPFLDQVRSLTASNSVDSNSPQCVILGAHIRENMCTGCPTRGAIDCDGRHRFAAMRRKEGMSCR